MKTEQEQWLEQILASAKRTDEQDPSSESYEKILKKIHNRPADKISLTWVKAVAAIFICLLTLEVFLTQANNQNVAELTEIIPENNNTIYYE